ncbi:MAG: sodium:alanine symporter family protein [Alphaproteobacteria bacterium]
METVEAILGEVSGFIWGPVMLALLLGTGVYLSAGLRLLPWRKLGLGIRLTARGVRKEKQKGEGEITPFQALSVALSGQIGTGNIAGVATALYFGGPGAIFWMWITALVGMATQYSEAVLAVRFRKVDEAGRYVGGPMYYIRHGLHRRWHWLAVLFALFAMIAAFGIGNMVQANSVAHVFGDSLERYFEIPRGVTEPVTGLILAGLIFIVIIGGVRRIAEWAERLVPVMAVAYVAGALLILAMHAPAIPMAFAQIFTAAFTGEAAAGGAAGGGILLAIRWGVARGVFSNEAGLGSTPIAHAAARTTDPVNQGMIAMLGTFIDTIVVCTMTALVILVTGALASGLNGAALSALAFSQALPGLGDFIVTFGLVVFAFTTLLAWSYYGERCVEYLFGLKLIPIYRLVWVVMIFVGALGKLNLVWLLSDVMNGLMAIPNLLALLLLSPLVFKLSREYFARRAQEAEPVPPPGEGQG